MFNCIQNLFGHTEKIEIQHNKKNSLETLTISSKLKYVTNIK